MSVVLKCLGAFIGWSLVSYLLTSFVHYDLNPGNWDHTGRLFSAMVAFVGTLLHSLFIAEYEER